MTNQTPGAIEVSIKRVAVTDVECSDCAAKPGQACLDLRGHTLDRRLTSTIKRPHYARYLEASRAASDRETSR